MGKTEIIKLLIFLFSEMLDHGKDIIDLIMGPGDIKDSVLYKRLPRERQTRILRKWREAQRLGK
jgi:hypothetical protein